METAQAVAPVTVPAIVEAVGRFFSVPENELKGKRREQSLVRARHVCMLLARRHAGLSLAQIGEQLGSRDHSTVLHGLSVIQERMKAQTLLFAQVQTIERELLQG